MREAKLFLPPPPLPLLSADAAAAHAPSPDPQQHQPQLSGTPERPRLAVFRTNEHIYAQVIDDVAGRTLAAASTLTPEIKQALGAAGGEDGGASSSSRSVAAAEAVGKKIAELCSSKGISTVAYDRGGFAYHGRISALADAAREGGLKF
jgi:large subunit ribosomal protein L18